MNVTTMNELELYKKKLWEEVEGMKEEIFGDLEMNLNIKKQAKNQALDDVLTLLQTNQE
jgi:hypothetical protein